MPILERVNEACATSMLRSGFLWSRLDRPWLTKYSIRPSLLAIIRKRIFLDFVRLVLGDLLEFDAEVVEVAVG